ncbi:FAD-dependent oxidoreductase [Roseovarius sp. TE539]|uniref:tRNA (5-methylaminomethyl-2-thiouridine)(34)-methyltransferase MnmD n=1 Tax=Roseovarius sp. TE539 TaxID=2249812 RepID=UPI000DDD306F|nr:tRNA (5-methylaminomethyl-2-thiouridine)(34)-methyltransferase MnmD [Roseovarius sp. TE539]RBI76003.1 FAD-dependent oxidoreductase [Roseovarius sp. TE539]
MQDQRIELEWRAGDIPVSARFDDPYYNLGDGLAETRHVFLGGNDLPARFREGFRIAELGFGTGLNLLTAIQAWRHSGRAGRLTYTAFEAFPMKATDMIRAQSRFPELAELIAELAPFWHADKRRISLRDLEFRLVPGDARRSLPGWTGRADAWFLDGFAPSKNPEMWETPLLAAVADHTSPGGTVATYTAAGHVRRGLAKAGFSVERVPGFGRKRHMTRAVMEPGT